MVPLRVVKQSSGHYRQSVDLVYVCSYVCPSVRPEFAYRVLNVFWCLPDSENLAASCYKIMLNCIMLNYISTTNQMNKFHPRSVSSSPCAGTGLTHTHTHPRSHSRLTHTPFALHLHCSALRCFCKKIHQALPPKRGSSLIEFSTDTTTMRHKQQKPSRIAIPYSDSM